MQLMCIVTHNNEAYNHSTKTSLHKCKFYTKFAYAILVPVRVLLVTWCVLINESCKQSNFCVFGTFPDFQLLTRGFACAILFCY